MRKQNVYPLGYGMLLLANNDYIQGVDLFVSETMQLGF